MISVAPTVVTRNPDFVVATPSASSPYILGVLDAERGEAFCPENYFAWDGDLLAYTEGFEAVRGENEITRDFKRGIVEAVDLEEYMADTDWIRHGC